MTEFNFSYQTMSSKLDEYYFYTALYLFELSLPSKIEKIIDRCYAIKKDINRIITHLEFGISYASCMC